MSEEPDLDTLREQTEHGDRLDEDAAQVDRQDLRDSLVASLAKIEDGDQQKTVSVWDGELAAFMTALETHPDHLNTLGEKLRKEYDVEDEDEVDRSEVLRLALRIGLRQAAPEYMETVRDAVREHATRDL